MNNNYQLIYMNQPLRVRKGKQGALYGIKVESQQGFVSRITSRPSESQSHTPRVSVKKQKTPVKVAVNEKQQQNSKKHLTKQPKASKSINKTFYDYQSSCQTRTTPTPAPITKCSSCQAHQQQYNQLSQTLLKYEHDQRQLKTTLNQLKQQYQKSLRKYKVKSKIQKDELKLLKWILSQRKQFHLILQQLQEMKQTRYRLFDEQGKENIDENTCNTDRSVMQKQKSQQINITTTEPQRRDLGKKTQTKLIQTSEQLQAFKTPTSRELQMFNHINVLEQKVMELTVKNDFLERLKIKQQHNYYSSNLIHEMNSKGQLRSQRQHHHNHHRQRDNPHRYMIDDEDEDEDDEIVDELSFDRQLLNAGSANKNCESLLVGSLNNKRQKRRGEVESRYVSPYRDFHKVDQRVINNGIALPESRSSRYCDSIKQRSRLLQF